jgi:hypothetical protein
MLIPSMKPHDGQLFIGKKNFFFSIKKKVFLQIIKLNRNL